MIMVWFKTYECSDKVFSSAVEFTFQMNNDPLLDPAATYAQSGEKMALV